MPNVDIVVEEILDATVDPDHPATVAVEAFQARSLKAKRGAAALRKAADGWAVVRSDTDWECVVDQAAENYRVGTFLIAQLGGEGTLDPPLMATLLSLRETIVEDWKIEAAAEFMLLDLALLAYRNALRIQSWIENLAYLIEAESFGLDTPSARFRYQFADKLTAEEHAARLREGLLPLQDRANRMFVRNLQAIRELRRGSVTTIVASQVNVGNKQVNIAG